MDATEVWYITPRDTVYFGSGMPFNAGESGYLQSIFPPSPRVMQGFVRTAILAAHGIDWDSYYEGYCNVCGKAADQCEVLAAVGSAARYDDILLELHGPVIQETLEGRTILLFPAPRDLVRKGRRLVRLVPADEETVCDLGSVRLPRVQDKGGSQAISGGVREGIEDLSGYWITEDGLKRHLMGEDVGEDDLRRKWELLDTENRVGIGRDSRTAAVKTGLLYSLGHIRLKEGYRLVEWVSQVPGGVSISRLALLGGEKRLAFVERQPSTGEGPSLTEPELKQQLARGIDASEGHFRLIFLQPGLLDFADTGSPFGNPPRFFPGLPGGLDAVLICACQPRPQRLGGWNIAARDGQGKVRGGSIPMEPVIPPGSVFFFETRARGGEVVDALHGSKLGREPRIGFGHVVVGIW